MPRAHANGIELEYETFGDSVEPAILLVMGLGIQMLGWHEGFCQMLVDRGYFVIRYDNRDVGLSSKIEDGPQPDLMRLLAGDFSSASYTLDDMADDAAGLLDALGIEKAHVVGVSMGGMIGQTLAIEHPDRVLSLTSIMSTTGSQTVGQPRQDVLMALVTPAPEDRDGFIEFQANLFQLIGSPDYPIAGRRAPRADRPLVRPHALPGRVHAPARRDHGLGRPHFGARERDGPDRRDPRRGRPADPAERRRGDRERRSPARSW